MIRTEEFLTSEGEFAMSALPVHDERVQPTVMWRTFVEFRGTTLANLSTTHVTEIFILDRYIVQKLDGQFQEVRELQRPYSIDALALVIRRWSMLSIDLKSIEPTELPSELKDIPALIKRMKEGPTHENADNQKVPVAGH